MADEVRVYAVTVPAGTTKAVPLVSQLPMPPRLVRSLQVLVPPGPAGLVGFQIAAGGQAILPYNDAQWIVTDREVIDWPLEGMPEAGAWALRAYNLGRFDHTLSIRMLLGLPGLKTPSPPLPLSSATLGGVLS